MASVRIRVRLVPRAKQNAINGWINAETLKIRVTAPPVDGKANKALVTLLAETFECAASSITITAGQLSRNKTVEIFGKTFDDVRAVVK